MKSQGKFSLEKRMNPVYSPVDEQKLYSTESRFTAKKWIQYCTVFFLAFLTMSFKYFLRGALVLFAERFT